MVTQAILHPILGAAFTIFIIGNAAAPVKEARHRIAIIDTGLDLRDPRFKDVLCPDGHADFTGQGIYDRNGHGTHVAGTIAERLTDKSKVCLMILKYFTISQSGFKNQQKEKQAIAYAISRGAAIVNISGGGEDYDVVERALIAYAPEVTFVVAAGNEGRNYRGNQYPADYRLPNIKVVGNWDCEQNRKGPASNYGPDIVWRCGTNIYSTLPGGKRGYMSGTSQATPMLTAELANKL